MSDFVPTSDIFFIIKQDSGWIQDIGFLKIKNPSQGWLRSLMD